MIRPTTPRLVFPPRSPGSVRRVMHLDFTWRDAANVDVSGAARDELTDDQLVVTVIDESSLEVRSEGGVTTTVTPDPPAFAPDALAGLRPMFGFSRRAREVHPADGSTLGLLLDDLPGSAVASGYALARRWEFEPNERAKPPSRASGDDTPRQSSQVDNCSGWRAGSTINVAMKVATDTGESLRLLPAPPVDMHPFGDGEWPTAPIPSPGLRRLRSIDVVPNAVAGTWSIDAWFRDAYRAPDGKVEVVHEFTAEVTVDAAEHRILAITAIPHVLPWPECPSAADSVTRLVGQSLDDLRTVTQRMLSGIECCTHLNSELRALADVPTMVERTPGPR
jgi:hypothetical protein